MLRHFKTLTIRTGLIALILLATIPEVRCCCDVSWGPAGLFASRVRCGIASSLEPKPDCCCCPEQEEGTSPAEECSDQDCHCRHFLVGPSPMTAGPGAVSAPAPGMEVWSRVSAAPILSPPLAAREVDEQPDSALTPVQRCAHLQRWLA